jgi:hypothetical protein
VLEGYFESKKIRTYDELCGKISSITTLVMDDGEAKIKTPWASNPNRCFSPSETNGRPFILYRWLAKGSLS